MITLRTHLQRIGRIRTEKRTEARKRNALVATASRMSDRRCLCGRRLDKRNLGDKCAYCKRKRKPERVGHLRLTGS